MKPSPALYITTRGHHGTSPHNHRNNRNNRTSLGWRPINRAHHVSMGAIIQKTLGTWPFWWPPQMTHSHIDPDLKDAIIAWHKAREEIFSYHVPSPLKENDPQAAILWTNLSKAESTLHRLAKELEQNENNS